jgi:hypothetical protein
VFVSRREVASGRRPLDRHSMYTDIENTGAPMVPESTRREPENPDDARRFREEMVLSHRLADQ